ncbi:MAG: GTP-binding protein [Candidatus Odinarchaeota archaeon]
MDKTINLKLVVFGEGEVGKTAIINSFMQNQFPEEYLPTIGNKTTKKEYIIEQNGNTIRLLISIWDTGGKRSYNPFNQIIYKNIDMAILVFDLTKPKETLNQLKEEFLKHLNNYSEDVLSLFIGNKFDSITDEQQIKTSLINFLQRNENVIFVSAKTAKNVNECFEILIYTFLRKAEILAPDKIQKNSALSFLKSINKTENQLKAILVNLNNLDSKLKKIRIKPEEKVHTVEEKEVKELKYFDFLKKELEKNSIQKSTIMDHFLINLSELTKTIEHLKKNYSRSPKELIHNLKELFILTQKDFEQNVNLIEKLNREEFELVKIISKTKEEQLNQELSLP